jgi:hypothetical protein
VAWVTRCPECGQDFQPASPGPEGGRPPKWCSARCRWRHSRREIRRRAREARQAAQAALERDERKIDVPAGIDPQAGWPRKGRGGRRATGTTGGLRFPKETVRLEDL